MTSMNLDCLYFNSNKCHSCSLLEFDNKEQILFRKQSLVSKLLEPLEGVYISNLFSPKKLFHSRAKARLSVTGSVENVVLGLVDENFLGIELESCPLHLELVNKVIKVLPAVIKANNLTPYNIKKRTGELKNIIVLSNIAETEVILRFVLKTKSLVEQIKKIVPVLQKEVPELKVVSANIQPVAHQIPEGEQEILLSEQDCIWQNYNQLEFAIGPKAFVQVSPETAEALYKKASSILLDLKVCSVLDLYCGVGGFAMHVAKQAVELRNTIDISGLEISSESIKYAKLSAQKNNLSSIKFFSGSVEQVLDKLDTKNIDAIICNPPRRGLGQKVIDDIISISPKYLVYSSCNVKTFLSDVGILKSNYKLREIHPFDMFPLTNHFEVLSVFEKVN